jgi:hypothetical protein
MLYKMSYICVIIFKQDLEEPECRPVKRSKTMEPQLTLDSEGYNFGMNTLCKSIVTSIYYLLHRISYTVL